MRFFRYKPLILFIGFLLASTELYAQESSAQSKETPSEKANNQASQAENDYVDQTINDNSLAPSILFGNSEDPNYDPTGLPHYLRIDAISSVSKNTDSNDSRENGISINSQFDTQNYGAFSINGEFRNEPSGQAGVILQRYLPFNNGWYANNGIGTLYTPSIDLTRNQTRFYIPTFPIAGISTEWLQQDRLQLQFASGTPGIFDGLQLNTFNKLGGNLTMAGAQLNISPQWQVGAQMINTNNVSTAAGSSAAFNQFFGLPPNADNTRTSGQSFYGTAAWQNDESRVQANLLHSQSDESSDATGIWIDAKKRTGQVLHSAGIFRLDPNLSWGYTPISNNIEGLYYRANYNSRQWLLDGGIDAVQGVSGSNSNGTLLTGSARYQVSQGLGLGGSATIRNADNDAQSGYLFTDMQNTYGTGRAQLDFSSENNSKQARLTASQNWLLSAGSQLSTSIYTEVERQSNQNINHFGASLNGGSDIFNNISWNGNLSYDKSNGSGSSNSISANLDLTARLNNHWSLVGSYLESRNASSNNPFIIQPLIPTLTVTDVTNGSAIYVTLRYETRGGTSSAPLGGVSGSAAGSIAGYVFLDANDNGISDAGEEPAKNITILLDGKFSTQTNALGRFEFPLVAAGNHKLTVIADNLPLPWQVSNAGQKTIQVNTRETNYVNIPASRIK
ncbi:MAG: SdrD B-like domain-containing protein [Methylophilaceae bacterium]